MKTSRKALLNIATAACGIVRNTESRDLDAGLEDLSSVVCNQLNQSITEVERNRTSLSLGQLIRDQTLRYAPSKMPRQYEKISRAGGQRISRTLAPKPGNPTSNV